MTEQAYHFRTGPDDGTVTVGGLIVGRTVVVERRIESHSCTHASTVHLPALLDLRTDGMPSELRHRAVSDAFYPSFVDGVGDAIYINGRGRSF